MSNEQIIKEVQDLLRQLKTPYIFIVRQDRDIRTSTFPTKEVAGELLARAVSGDRNIGDILTEAMKYVKFKPTNK
jgi:hypothetical protein